MKMQIRIYFRYMNHKLKNVSDKIHNKVLYIETIILT